MQMLQRRLCGGLNNRGRDLRPQQHKHPQNQSRQELALLLHIDIGTYVLRLLRIGQCV